MSAYGQADRYTAKTAFDTRFPTGQENYDYFSSYTFRGMRANTDFDQIQYIGLERTRCYGTCPAYDVLIRNNGEVEYAGHAYVEKIGRYKGQVDQWKLTNLFKYIMEIEYFDLQNIYRASVTDNPTVYTVVSINPGLPKAIMNYANAGPAELWALEQLIDQIIEGVEWQEM